MSRLGKIASGLVVAMVLCVEAQTSHLLTREGYKLTRPADGILVAPGSQSLGTEERIEAMRRPDSALLMTPEATLDPAGHSLADPEGYDQARNAWIGITANKEASASVLGNAGCFFNLHDKALAAQLYSRARQLEPENALWVGMQGSVMAFVVVGITAMNQNGFSGAADPAEAGSDFAKSIRREIETTKDTALMTATSGELMGRGLMAQSMARAQTGQAPPVTGGSSGPMVISRRDPEYSEEARKAGVQSAIVASLVVGEDGTPGDIRVKRGAGFGLDEKAIEAIGTWRFRPGMKEGKPVAVKATVEVSFRLLKKGHENQVARLNFTLTEGASRPEFRSGAIPANPSTSGDQSLRIGLEVNAEGVPENFHVLESTDSDWENTVLREMRSWRFHPSMVNGHGAMAEGVFELTHGRERVPQGRPE